MRRALLVTVGTVAGLATVLSYSDGSAPLVTDLAAATGGEGIGAPPPDDPAPGATPAAAPTAKATSTAKPKPKPSAKPATSKAAAPAASSAAAPAEPPAEPQPAPTTAAPKPAPTPKPTTSATAKPKPTPTPTKPAVPSGDFVGSAVTHKYGTVQVGIRVVDGVITKAWAVKYPTGDSAPYTEFSIPKLSAETVGAKSASVAAVAGATLTSKAWVTSLAAAMAKAGI